MSELGIFADRIKELRKTLDMTQKEFSSYIGIKQQTLSGYERGVMKPSLDIAKEIAEKCNVSMDWLCGLTENKREALEFNNYKDAALVILKLIETDIMVLYEKPATIMEIPLIAPSKILCCELKKNIKELNDFFQTYMDLFNLKCENKIKQNVIDAWLLTALEELDAIPICTEIPYGDLSPDDPPQDEPPTE